MLEAQSTSDRGTKSPLPWRAGLVLCSAIFLANAAASATSLTWSISGGTFEDGGTFSGTLVQSSASPNANPTSWNVTVAGGNEGTFPPRSYTPTDSTVFRLDWPPNTQDTYHFDALVGTRGLRLTPLGPLDGSLAIVPVSLLTTQGAVECFNCAPARDITGGSLVLESAEPTLTLQSITPNPTTIGATTTATISLAGVAAFGPPTGTVIVYDGANVQVCTILVPAATSCSFAPAVEGGQTLHAVYFGDANYDTASSNSLSYTVNPAQPTTVTIVSVTPAPTSIDTLTTATVTVDEILALGPPTGTIRVFLNADSTTLCTITLPATTCGFTPPEPGVDIQVGAHYSGNASYASGFANPVLMDVAPVEPVVFLSVAPDPIAVGALTTATVILGTVAPFPAPTGTVTVFDGNGNSLCTFTRPPNLSCDFAPTLPGSQVIVARYEGDANYDSGLSNLFPLMVLAPPTIAKDFAPLGILVGATSTLTFRLTNPNSGLALTDVGFTDTLPAGLTVVNGASSPCLGTGTLTTTAPDGIELVGATILPGVTCSFSVTVTGVTGGLKTNLTSPVTSTEGGTGGTALAFLVVVDPQAPAPPTIAKAFGAPNIVVNGTTTLTFTLTNANPVAQLTDVAFTDLLPAGLTVADSSNPMCGGTLATSGGSSIALSGATIAANGGICSFGVTVTGTTAGVKNNVTGAVTATGSVPPEDVTGGTAAASLTVIAPPTIAKSFGAANIAVDEITTLTFLLRNPNPAVALTGVGFSDPLPAGLVVATPNGLIGACGGGTITANAGGSTVELTGATLTAGTPCLFAVHVLAGAVGPQVNTTSPVTSANGGDGEVATASITVVAPLASVTIPTLSTLALAALAIGLLLIGLRRVHGT